MQQSLLSAKRRIRMHAAVNSVVSRLWEIANPPIKLARLLHDHPEIVVSLTPAKRTIHLDDVVKWHELGKPPADPCAQREYGRLLGGSGTGNDYESIEIFRPEYAVIGQRHTTADWTCDITSIDGFSESKSNLGNFSSTDEMVEKDSMELITPVTSEKLAENLAHTGIRIIHQPGSDSFVRCSWDDRLFLSNANGSHHLAAAKYLAKRLRQPVPLNGALIHYSLNAPAIASLRRDFEMFAISNSHEIWSQFRSAMQSFGVTWLSHPMPKPIETTRAILLPRTERRSMRVADMLRAAGIADLGIHSTALAEKSIADNLKTLD
jgi:hypothetical protein